jgi:6-phosphogluconate dehydrogenase
MSEREHHIGMVGLGVMGRNLLLNMADHDYPVAGYDKDPEKVKALKEEAEAGHRILAFDSMERFIDSLQEPRVVMMLVPAGSPVDAVIRDLLPHLGKGDILIDGGNSHFSDTDLRFKALAEKGLRYLGVGISGGSYGARHGPSMMPGGNREAYQRVEAIFESAAAQVDGSPCVAYLGPGSAGHYVKMVHNGIEYGIMQLIAESYDLMKRGVGLSDTELAEVYRGWNESELASYLLEITGQIFLKKDERTGKPLVDVILDAAKQKGTGMWTSQEAMDLQVPLPTIDTAVAMRHLSALEESRQRMSRILPGPKATLNVPPHRFLQQLRSALYLAAILTYTQGMALLQRASEQREYGFDLETVARIWRGGCIIRASLLEDIRGAYRRDSRLQSLLADSHFSGEAAARHGDLRAVVCSAAELGLPAPALMTSLAYLDGLRSGWLPANLIQAQRDYFGSHTYERVDAKGTFHTEWREE